MLHDIVLALWFFLPAGYGNMAPIFAAAIPGLKKFNAPIDGGKTFRGKRIFGTNKTWRGVVSGMLLATLILWLQQEAVAHFAWAAWAAHGVPYAGFPTWLLGPLFGLGALAGDAIESFFKRQRGIEAGQKWIPFDQLDYIIGGLVLSLPFWILTPWQYVWTFVLYFGIHFATSYMGYLFGLKKQAV